MTEPWQWNAIEAARQIATKRIAACEYLHALLARIARYEPRLQAWAQLAGDAAEAEASSCDADTARGASRGPLHGVAIAIKDIIDVAGMPTRVGSDLTDCRRVTSDSEVVRKLRAAGAIVLGKTSMTAFAAMDPAPTRNPWNGDHTPGGSSSGSAAAVAAQMCAASLGTQTAGSVLRPAAYCGIVGLKPTYDAVSRKGLTPCAWSMDHIGVIARDAADVELLFGILGDAAMPIKSDGNAAPVIGIAQSHFDATDLDTAEAFKGAVDTLSGAGARVVPVRLPDGFEALAAAGIVTMYAEMAASHCDLFARRRDEYPPRLRVLVEAGLAVSAPDYIHAQRVRHRASAALSSLLAGVTVLLTPTTGAPAPAGQRSTGDWRFNIPFSTSGHPAITLPCGMSKNGLPIGVQAVAAHGREDRLFAVGKLFQRCSDWHAQRAPMTSPEYTT
jgi:aspartyl-tRNA(Asn)/glutamyl-tRNA(Gln) amidotransferase subunit A